jgi:uncharacterized integral membrane protein
MQLMLIIGIVFAIGAVLFALQNNVPVVVTLAVWQFEGSLAMVLLLALGLGVLIAGLLSSPTVIRGQWAAARLRRQVADLERQVTEHQTRNNEFSVELARLAPLDRMPEPTSEAEKPYIGFREMLAGENDASLLAAVKPADREKAR